VGTSTHLDTSGIGGEGKVILFNSFLPPGLLHKGKGEIFLLSTFSIREEERVKELTHYFSLSILKEKKLFLLFSCLYTSTRVRGEKKKKKKGRQSFIPLSLFLDRHRS